MLLINYTTLTKTPSRVFRRDFRWLLLQSAIWQRWTCFGMFFGQETSDLIVFDQRLELDLVMISSLLEFPQIDLIAIALFVENRMLLFLQRELTVHRELCEIHIFRRIKLLLGAYNIGTGTDSWEITICFAELHHMQSLGFSDMVICFLVEQTEEESFDNML